MITEEQLAEWEAYAQDMSVEWPVAGGNMLQSAIAEVRRLRAENERLRTEIHTYQTLVWPPEPDTKDKTVEP